MQSPADILDYWLGNDVARGSWRPRRELWYAGGPEVDAEITARFGETLVAARRGELNAWAKTPRGRLALVILLDQLSRNVHRGTAEAFASDHEVQRLVLEALDAGDDRDLHPVERVFLYMPLMHSESPEHQERCVALFEALAEEPGDAQETARGSLRYAIEHRDLIARFGRFPHRNPILGRTSTPEERAFLEGGGATYGQTPR